MMLAFRCLPDNRLRYYTTFPADNPKSAVAARVLEERRLEGEVVPPPSEDTAKGPDSASPSPPQGAEAASANASPPSTFGSLVLDSARCAFIAGVAAARLVMLQLLLLLLELQKAGAASSFFALRVACWLSLFLCSRLIVRLLPDAAR